MMRLYGARAGVWAQGGCWGVRTVRGGGDGFQGCMACLRSACGCTARHTCGVQGLKAVCGGPRTTNAAGGLLSSTIRRRQRLVDGHKLVDTQADVQNVKKLGAGQEKGASG